MKLANSLVIGFLVIAAPVSATTGQPVTMVSIQGDVADTAEDAQAQSGDKLTCRRMSVTGSRVKKVRICLADSEWKRRAEGGQRTANDIVESSNKSIVNGG